jgi:hypothetical protein
MLLGVSRWWVRRAVKRSDFAGPTGHDARGRPYWHAQDVYQWAALTELALADRVPLQYWPVATTAAHYLGTRPVGDSAVALGWATGLGSIWVAWDYPVRVDRTLAKALDALPGAAAIATIGGDFGFSGPAVWVILPGLPDRGKYEVGWSKLSEVLGQPMPFWPVSLRIPELLKAWQPGSAAAVAAARTEFDVAPLLRLAAILEAGSLGQRVLLDLAQTWQSNATRDAERDLEAVKERARPGITVVAATPLKVPDTGADDLDEAMRRAGWLEILARGDDLAAVCIRQKVMWDGGSDFPASNPEPIDPHSTYGQEWAQRLTPPERPQSNSSTQTSPRPRPLSIPRPMPP